MKICFVLPHFYPYVGGGERIFYDMVKGFLPRGHEIRILAEAIDEEYTGHKTVEGMDVYYYPWKELFGHPIIPPRDIEEHIKWADVVHASIFTPALPASYLARKYRKPSMLTIHEVRGEKWFWVESPIRALGFWFFEQLVCRSPFDLYHGVSLNTNKDFLQYCSSFRRKDLADRTVCVYNSVTEMDTSIAETSTLTLKSYFNLSGNERVFLYYGRPGQTKGIYVYQNAILELKRRGVKLDNIRFCFIMGAEPKKLRKKFIDSIKKAGLSDKVLVNPALKRNDLCRCILDADYVVVPSVTEGFGLSALEACQMNKRIISSTGGALREVVYGDCLFFENRDSMDLADKLQSVIEKGADAFDHLPPKTFPYKDMLDGIEAMYNRLLEKDSASHSRKEQ